MVSLVMLALFFNIPSLKVTTLRDGGLSFPEIYIEGVWDPSLYKSVL